MQTPLDAKRELRARETEGKLNGNPRIAYSPCSLDGGAEKSIAMAMPHGFPNITDSDISFVDGTRTFTVEPASTTFDYYYQGDKITKSAASTKVIDNTTGVHWLYFDSAGDLQSATSTPRFKTAVLVAYVYWNSVESKGVLFEERHGISMDWETHSYLHSTRGAIWDSLAGGLEISGYTLDTDSDVAVTFGNSAGYTYDEDLRATIAAEADPGQYPVWFRAGSDEWYWDAATDYAFKNTAAGRVNWNELSGTWGQTQATDNYYVAYFICSTNATATHQIISIQGQREDAKLSDALTNNKFQDLTFGDIPFEELVVLYRVIVRTKDSFGGTRKAKLVNIQDLRNTISLPSGSFVGSSHQALNDRDAPGSHPAEALAPGNTNDVITIPAAPGGVPSWENSLILGGLTMNGNIVLANTVDLTAAVEFGSEIGSAADPFGDIHVADGLFYSLNDGANNFFKRANGTWGTKTKVLDGTGLGAYRWYGWHGGGAYGESAIISVSAREDFDDANSLGSYMSFGVTDNSDAAPSTYLALDGKFEDIRATRPIAIRDGLELRFYDVGNSHYVGFEAPALTGSQIYVLPAADGSPSDHLKTDGGGNLGWEAPVVSSVSAPLDATAGVLSLKDYSFAAYGAGQTVTDGNEDAIDFSTEQHDPESIFTAGSDKLLISTGDPVWITVRITISSLAGAATAYVKTYDNLDNELDTLHTESNVAEGKNEFCKLVKPTTAGAVYAKVTLAPTGDDAVVSGGASSTYWHGHKLP